MTSTSTPLGADFPRQVVELLLSAIDEGTKQAARMLWSILTSFLLEHWIAVFVGLFGIFIFALVRAFATRRWAMLGSVTYNYLYFGTLFLIGTIWGPEVFANDYFKIVLVILYIVCFILTGKFLSKIGLHR
jgi:hypothetical protein